MARRRSEDKRNAILAAATRVIGAQGMGATTAEIAREAGVATGSLFVYFKTKAELLNELYVDLRRAMAAAAMRGVAPEGESRRQFLHLWTNWTGWGVTHPKKRRVLALLEVSEEMTAESRAAGQRAMAGMGELVVRVHENGAMHGASLGLVVALMESAAGATMDMMVRDRANAEAHGRMGFEAVWRMIG